MEDGDDDARPGGVFGKSRAGVLGLSGPWSHLESLPNQKAGPPPQSFCFGGSEGGADHELGRFPGGADAAGLEHPRTESPLDVLRRSRGLLQDRLLPGD